MAKKRTITFVPIKGKIFGLNLKEFFNPIQSPEYYVDKYWTAGHKYLSSKEMEKIITLIIEQVKKSRDEFDLNISEDHLELEILAWLDILNIPLGIKSIKEEDRRLVDSVFKNHQHEVFGEILLLEDRNSTYRFHLDAVRKSVLDEIYQGNSFQS